MGMEPKKEFDLTAFASLRREPSRGFLYPYPADLYITHPEHDFPVPNHREVTSQNIPGTLLQGVMNC
jgi:hypothetical protein